jgi:hypothetical protein
MCQAKVDDRNDKIKEVAGQAGVAVLSIGGIILTKGKDIAKHIPKK